MLSFKKTVAGLGTALALGGGSVAVDGSKLTEIPIDKVDTVAGYTIQTKQVADTVETTLPWKDQVGIKVKYDMGVPTLAEKLADKRKKEVITQTVTDFDGGFKVDILLNEKPSTNVFCYAIEGAENYDFFYQPPLTQEEIAEGSSRPPEIEGSYAVYHKTLANHIEGKTNYETGKVMHIPRPQVWSLSDESTKVWADMHYDAGQLCVTVPQDFLNKAEYPVRVDPTFGYTTIGASTNGTLANTIQCGNGNPSTSGTVTTISVYTTDSGNESLLKGSLYASSTESLQNPQSTEITTTNGSGWESVSLSSLSVTNQSYLICVWAPVTTGNFLNYDSGGTNNRFRNLTYGSWPDPLSSSASSQLKSIYATYTESGGSSPSESKGKIIIFE